MELKMRERNKQKQLWSDKEFVARLENIKAQRLIAGKPVKNLGELTKEMLNCPSFKDVENELVRKEIQSSLKIKLDNKNLFK